MPPICPNILGFQLRKPILGVLHQYIQYLHAYVQPEHYKSPNTLAYTKYFQSINQNINAFCEPKQSESPNT